MGRLAKVGHDKLLISLARVTLSTGATQLFALLRCHSKRAGNPSLNRHAHFLLARSRSVPSKPGAQRGKSRGGADAKADVVT